MKSIANVGLEGVVVAETRLSDVQGDQGRLIVAGYDVEELARRAGFEAALELLWTGSLPDPSRHAERVEALGAARLRAASRLTALGGALEHEDGMDALRGAIGQLSSSTDADELVAAVAVFAAAWWRARSGKPPIAPAPGLTHAADYLWMCHGRRPEAEEARALDAYLVTVLDHGLNASTFAARVVASTGSDLVSSVSAAISALKGPLHGGAPGPVLDMLDAVARAGDARAWLARELREGRRIMGMGHRVYRVRDPRAAVLEQALESLGNSERLSLARDVERAAEALLRERHPARALRANVEFYTALLLDAVGLHKSQFSPTFAVGRVGGWVAHVDEQRRHGRLIRPSSVYVGSFSASGTA